MNAVLPAVALAAVAATALPAHAQDGRRDDGLDIQRRTSRLLREKGPSVLSVRVITRAVTMPRLVLPGVTLAPTGGADERIDATGFVATEDGCVVTTAAALRDAAFVEVRFADGTVRDADILGIDAPFRIGVLRTRPPDETDALSVPASSRAIAQRLGWFFQAAAGRPDVQPATVREADTRATAYDRWLYSAQALVDGGAGGPLLSDDGRLLGMAVGEVLDPRAADDPGAGVAQATLFVRGADVHAAVRDILRFGKVQRPMLGVVLDRDTNRIDQLLPGSPAEIAGLREGDCLVRIADDNVRSLADITRTLLRRDIGETIELAIERDGESLRSKVRLTAMDLPELPETEPLPGAALQIAGEENAQGGRTVSFTDVRVGSTLHTAGVRPGDRLVSVDGRDAMRFLARHRIRPADALPHTLTIERGDERHVIPLTR